MRCYVLMGVSGCGKSSVGAALADECGVTFVDGDDLHPRANVEKMSRGEALNDDDRTTWLVDVGQKLARTDGPVVVGCSALKRRYRDWIRAEVPEPIGFIHLDADKSVLAQRVAERRDHFMPASLLDSQFAALEALEADENGREIDISRALPEVIRDAKSYVLETLT